MYEMIVGFPQIRPFSDGSTFFAALPFTDG
jgi:hypothetical protein